MKLSAKKTTGWYAPDRLDSKGGRNRESREREAFIVPANSGRLEEIRSTEVGLATGDLSTRAAQITLGLSLRNRTVAECVRDLKGYVNELEDGTSVVLKTGPELVAAILETSDESAVEELDDLYEAIKDASKLSEGLRSELRRPSERSPPSPEISADGVVIGVAEPSANAPKSPTPSAERNETATT